MYQNLGLLADILSCACLNAIYLKQSSEKASMIGLQTGTPEGSKLHNTMHISGYVQADIYSRAHKISNMSKFVDSTSIIWSRGIWNDLHKKCQAKVTYQPCVWSNLVFSTSVVKWRGLMARP